MIPLYKNSLADAKEMNIASQWWESHYENVNCKDFIEERINAQFDDSRLSGDVARDSFDEFGMDRTRWVLANTVQIKSDDGRFSAQNKEWARGFFIPRNFNRRERDYTRDYLIENVHPGLVNLVVTSARKHYAALNLYDNRHRIQGDIHEQNFTNRLLILRDDMLNETSRTPENQLFLASGGFGCNPNAIGRAVFGEFLIDGEKTRFERQDFVGICDERYLANWAKEKLRKLAETQGESEGLTIGGM